MKLAIVHDDLMRRGGAEQVALNFQLAFPHAPFYTLCYQPELTYTAFKQFQISTSWFQNLVSTENQMKRLFFPLGIWAMQSLNLKDFDIILISSTFCGKYITVRPDTIVVTYCHTPFRLAWYPETYFDNDKTWLIKRNIIKGLVYILKRIDKKFALRTNFFIANSSEVVKRIQNCYTNEIPISIIYPPVNISKFFVSNLPKDYYLIVSRFQPYKKIELVIDVFKNLRDKKLVIIGSGVLENELKLIASDNVEFKGVVNAAELSHLFANCKALIFPQHEDFGITPLEANASGRPVIAYGEGGVLETMVPFKEKGKPFSAIFFNKQNSHELTRAIHLFEEIEEEIDPVFIRSNAERFNTDSFISEIQKFVKNIGNRLK